MKPLERSTDEDAWAKLMCILTFRVRGAEETVTSGQVADMANGADVTGAGTA